MPRIYLSPSSQEKNQYYSGNSEEYYMNKVADAMEPYLVSSGIQFTRNNPNNTLKQDINESNSEDYNFHIALHSNAAPKEISGTVTGSDMYYYPKSKPSQRMADILVENFKDIYPNPSKVRAIPSTKIAETRLTKAPSVLLEIAFHDNPDDEKWIKDNIDLIAKTIVLSLSEYFGIPFISPQPIKQAKVETVHGSLNLRSKPSVSADIITKIPNGSIVKVVGQEKNWYVIEYNNMVGYVFNKYIIV